MNERRDTETHCHCGGEYHGCDHCPECGCEQYETQNVRKCGGRYDSAYGAGHQRLNTEILLNGEQVRALRLALRSAEGHAIRNDLPITSASLLEWEDDNTQTCVTLEVLWAEIGEIRKYTLG